MIYNTSSEDFNKKLKNHKQILLVDVREQWEFLCGHILNAINIPINELSLKAQNLERNIAILIYCQHGHRSARGAEILQNIGFEEIFNLQNGIVEYAAKFELDLIRY